MAFQNEGVERVAWPLFDVGSQVEDGEFFSTKGWWGLERVGVRLFTCPTTNHEVRHVKNGSRVHIDMNPLINKKMATLGSYRYEPRTRADNPWQISQNH